MKPTDENAIYSIINTWADSNPTETERPDDEKILAGWHYGEEPSHKHFNFFVKSVGKWLSYFDTTIGVISAAIAGQTYIPIGGIIEYSGEVLPSANFAWADGSGLDTTIYNSLFAIIGYKYGGSGSTFLLPNRQGRVGIGYDSSQSEFNTIGKLGGAKTVSLTQDQLPIHNHNGQATLSGQHAHSVTDPGHSHLVAPLAVDLGDGGIYNKTIIMPKSGNFSQTGITVNASGDHTHSVTTDNVGGNQGHNNLQPYITLRYLIRIK